MKHMKQLIALLLALVLCLGFRRSRGYFISIKVNITVMVRVSPMTDTYPA